MRRCQSRRPVSARAALLTGHNQSSGSRWRATGGVFHDRCAAGAPATVPLAGASLARLRPGHWRSMDIWSPALGRSAYPPAARLNFCPLSYAGHCRNCHIRPARSVGLSPASRPRRARPLLVRPVLRFFPQIPRVPVQHPRQREGVRINRAQQGSRRAERPASPRFPIAQRVDADADEPGKLALRCLELRPNLLDVDGFEVPA